MQQYQITPATQFDTKELLLGALSTFVPFSIEVFNSDIMPTVDMLNALRDKNHTQYNAEIHQIESALYRATSRYFFKTYGVTLCFALPSIAETVFLQEWKRLCAHEKSQQTSKQAVNRVHN